MLDSTRVINGTYGEVIHEGKWMMNIFGMTAEIEINIEEIKRSGSRWAGRKVTGVAGSGSIKGYKVTSELMQKVSSVCDDRGTAFKTELISKLDDPEAFGAERIRLKGVMFDKIPLVGWEVGAIIEEEWSFTFEGFDLLDPIIEL